MDPVTPTYNYYIYAYSALATELGIEAEELLKELWRYRPGQVREVFVGEVSYLYARERRQELTDQQRVTLGKVADNLFARKNIGNSVDKAAETKIVSAWKRALE
jgi:hypothetical protein